MFITLAFSISDLSFHKSNKGYKYLRDKLPDIMPTHYDPRPPLPVSKGISFYLVAKTARDHALRCQGSERTQIYIPGALVAFIHCRKVSYTVKCRKSMLKWGHVKLGLC